MATPTTTPQMNNLIGWIRKNNRAARAARFLVQFFDVVCQTTSWNFQIWGSVTTTRPTTETLSFSASKSLLIAYSLGDLPLYSKTSKVSVITINECISQTTQPNIFSILESGLHLTLGLQCRRNLGFQHFDRHVVLIRWKWREGRGNG